MAFTVELETPDGVFTVVCETAENVREILGLSATSPQPKAKRSKRSKKRGANELAPGLETDVWNFLCENDCETGTFMVEVENYIEGTLKRSRSSASPVLSSLKRKSHAYKLSNDNWRACVPE